MAKLRKVICDTDFLMKIANDPLPDVDWKALSKENEFATLPAVLSELGGLSRSKKNKTARRAKNTLNLIRNSRMVGVTPSEVESAETDMALLEFVRAQPSERALATMDGSLLSRLEKLGLPYLTLSRGRVLFKKGRAQSNIFNR